MFLEPRRLKRAAAGVRLSAVVLPALLYLAWHGSAAASERLHLTCAYEDDAGVERFIVDLVDKTVARQANPADQQSPYQAAAVELFDERGFIVRADGRRFRLNWFTFNLERADIDGAAASGHCVVVSIQ